MGTFLLVLSYFLVARVIRKLCEGVFNWRHNGVSWIFVLLLPLLPLVVVIPLEPYIFSALGPDMATSAHAVILFSLILVEGFMLLRMREYGYFPEMHVQINTVSEDLAYRPYYTYAYCWRELPQKGFISRATEEDRAASRRAQLSNPKFSSQLAMIAICYLLVVGEFFLIFVIMDFIQFCRTGSFAIGEMMPKNFIDFISGLGQGFFGYIIFGSLIYHYAYRIIERYWPINRDASVKKQWQYIFIQASLLIPVVVVFSAVVIGSGYFLGLM